MFNKLYLKILELDKIMDFRDVLANFFMNYSSVYENDKIFLIKKSLSKQLNVDIKDIRLIGSAHIGISLNKRTKEILKRKKPKDLDFVIINQELFEKEYRKIEDKKLYKPNKYLSKSTRYLINPEEQFKKNYRRGKLHLRYVSDEYEILKICKSINSKFEKKFSLGLKISCCIYETEELFLKNQNNYYEEMFELLKQEQVKKSKIYG